MPRAWTAVFLLLIYSATPAYAEAPNDAQAPTVTVVLSEDGGPYVEFGNALHAALSASGLTVVEINAAQPIPDSGLVIGVGMKAATAVASSGAPAVLNVLITKAGYENLLRDFPRRAAPHAFSAIFLDQPAYRQVSLIAALLPEKRSIGLLYSAPPAELVQLRKEMTGHGLSLRERAVNATYPLAEALQEILRSSEVLLALPDAPIYNNSTIRDILLTTYRKGVPLIGLSPGYVKAGALGAVYSTPVQIAAQAAALIRKFGDGHALPPAQYPQEFEVMVNEQVAHSLGLQIKSAAALHDEMSAEDRKRL